MASAYQPTTLTGSGWTINFEKIDISKLAELSNGEQVSLELQHESGKTCQYDLNVVSPHLVTVYFHDRNESPDNAPSTQTVKDAVLSLQKDQNSLIVECGSDDYPADFAQKIHLLPIKTAASHLVRLYQRQSTCPDLNKKKAIENIEDVCKTLFELDATKAETVFLLFAEQVGNDYFGYTKDHKAAWELGLKQLEQHPQLQTQSSTQAEATNALPQPFRKIVSDITKSTDREKVKQLKQKFITQCTLLAKKELSEQRTISPYLQNKLREALCAIIAHEVTLHSLKSARFHFNVPIQIQFQAKQTIKAQVSEFEKADILELHRCIVPRLRVSSSEAVFHRLNFLPSSTDSELSEFTHLFNSAVLIEVFGIELRSTALLESDLEELTKSRGKTATAIENTRSNTEESIILAKLNFKQAKIKAMTSLKAKTLEQLRSSPSGTSFDDMAHKVRTQVVTNLKKHI
ncbi:hypothetical protein [Parashewanella tropica]|uniref:hypothetical protein n=1 Tax=Parashewanella tropica TaxID=2547970 RepID=UPI0010592F0E|nr:hypothetical protein [Parashewanella tropica]